RAPPLPPPQVNPESRFSGFVQQFHLPLGVFGKLSGNVRDHVAADAGHFLPGGVLIDKLRAVIVDACVLAMSNAEEEDRHGKLNRMQNGRRWPLKMRESGWSGFLARGKINSGFLRADAVA